MSIAIIYDVFISCQLSFVSLIYAIVFNKKLFMFFWNFLYELFFKKSRILLSIFFSQILNLTQALKDKKTPAQLVQMPPVYVQRRRTASDVRDGRGHSFVQSFHDKIPFFSWC